MTAVAQCLGPVHSMTPSLGPTLNPCRRLVGLPGSLKTQPRPVVTVAKAHDPKACQVPGSLPYLDLGPSPLATGHCWSLYIP